MPINTTIRLSIVTLVLAVSSISGVEAKGAPRIKGLDARIEILKEQGHFPGVAIAVMRKGKPVHIGTYGMANIGHSVAVTTQTVFELASLTKQMTALAVMTLVKDGRLSLGDRLVDYIEDAPEAWAKITVDELLAHKSGTSPSF